MPFALVSWRGLVAVAIVAGATRVGRPQPVTISPQHGVVEFLRRLQTRGLLSQAEDALLPWSREQVRRWLRQVSRGEHRGSRLSRVERDELQVYTAEFLGGTGAGDSRLKRVANWAARGWAPAGHLYENSVDFLSWKEGFAELHFNPLVVRTRSWRRADTLVGRRADHEDKNGVSVWGTLGNRLGFSFAVTDARVWGAPHYSRSMNITAPGLGFVNGFGDHLEHDETEAFLALAFRNGLVGYGKLSNVWGPGRFGHLLLSNAGPSFDQARLWLTAGRFSFVWVYGFLRFYQEPGHHTLPPPRKGITAHRLVFRAGRRLTLGFSEAVVFGRRWFVPAYLNPIMFYRSAEHFWGDEDNAVMGADFQWRPVDGVELYGEGLLDDFSVKKAGTGWYGDKWAILLGAEFVKPVAGGDLSVVLEYAKLRPYVYSHKDSLTAYAHFITVLGHPSGPNSDEWSAQLRYRPTWRLAITATGTWRRHGANPPGLNVGGSWRLGHVYGDPQRVPFLAGLREWQKRLWFDLNWRLAYQLHLSFAAGWAWGTVRPGRERTVACRALRFALGLDFPGLPR